MACELKRLSFDGFDKEIVDAYTKEETDQLLENIIGMRVIIVEELPAEGEPRVIYLVPKEDGGYTEHLWVETEQTFEEIGDTDIDLEDYYTKAEADSTFLTCDDLSDCSAIQTMADEIDKKANKSDVEDELEKKADKTEATTSEAGLMSPADKSKLDGMTPADYLTCDSLSDCDAFSNALAGKQDTLTAGDNIEIDGDVISATDTTYENATATNSGLMSASDKSKLDSMTPSDYLTCDTLSNCESFTTALNGKQDTLSPVGPVAIDKAATATEISVSNATTTNDGLMSASDKSKLDGMTPDDYLTCETVGDCAVIQGKADKADTYTKDEVDTLIGDIETSHIKVVDELPTEGEANIVYYIKNGDTYDQYIYDTESGEFVKIGNTTIDLTDYLKTEDLCSEMTNCEAWNDLVEEAHAKQDALSPISPVVLEKTGTVTEISVNNATTTSAGLMSASDKAKLDSINPSDYLMCHTLTECDSYKELQTEVGNLMSRDNLLAILGYEEITLKLTDTDGNTVQKTILSKIETNKA